jgi:hypothetical protein
MPIRKSWISKRDASSVGEAGEPGSVVGVPGRVAKGEMVLRFSDDVDGVSEAEPPDEAADEGAREDIVVMVMAKLMYSVSDDENDGV